MVVGSEIGATDIVNAIALPAQIAPHTTNPKLFINIFLTLPSKSFFKPNAICNSCFFQMYKIPIASIEAQSVP